MPETIKDGTGTGFLQKVDSTHRAWTRAITSGEAVEANGMGNAYNINTGLITLTDAVDTPVVYFKNNEAEFIEIEAIAIGVYPSTGATGHVTATFIRNPTTGTIISSPTNVDINSNRNYGSSKTLAADAYKGATGNTMTDGDDHILVNLGASGRAFIGINEVITKGTIFGVKIDPAAGNTSQTVYVAIICYKHNEV